MMIYILRELIKISNNNNNNNIKKKKKKTRIY